MIRGYHRPDSLDAALALLARKEMPSLPMGGGTVLNRPGPGAFDVVDLQDVGLDQIEPEGNGLSIGATVTLETVNHYAGLPQGLARAVQLELPLNLRQMATAAGQLVAANGRSTYTCAMLALDARLLWAPGDVEIPLGDWLPLRSTHKLGSLITSIKVQTRSGFIFESIGRSPEDLPLLCLAAARWPSGRLRIALGGFGDAPVVAFDGPEPGGADVACRDAYSRAGDSWASAEYRSEMAAVLARRAVAAFMSEVK
jgi:CO/xanthine dehydrogenase FAD-binding subunit